MKPLAYIVDDEEPIRDALAWLLRSRGVASREFASAEEFLAAYDAELSASEAPACLLLDVRMGEMSGLALFDELRRRQQERGSAPQENDRFDSELLPVIFLTGHGDVPMAVSAVKQGAFDFFEKPFNDNTLVDRVLEALDQSTQQLARRNQASALQQRFASLTPREMEVAQLVVAGKYNKVIADELGVSIRTVEAHRASVFEKLGVRTAAQLASLMAGKD